MKKVLAVALLCTVSSFAAWDKFPVIEDGKGEAEVGLLQGRQGHSDKWIDAGLRIRYSPLQNLELMTKTSLLGEDYTIGASYQVLPSMLSAGVDVGFPILGTAWSFTPNVQFSMDMGALALGTNVGLTIYTEDADKYARGMDLDAGIEVDFSMGKSTLWVGFDISTGLSKSEYAGNKVEKKDEGLNGTYRSLDLKPSFGYVASVSDNLSVGTWAELGFGSKDDGYGDNFKTTVGIDANIKF